MHKVNETLMIIEKNVGLQDIENDIKLNSGLGRLINCYFTYLDLCSEKHENVITILISLPEEIIYYS